MRRLGLLLAVVMLAAPVLPARADTVVDVGVYVNAQAAGYCEDLLVRIPAVGPPVCHFPILDPALRTVRALAMDATFKLKPVMGYVSFEMDGGSTTPRQAFCEDKSFPVPAGARVALIQVASVTDVPVTDRCTFGTTGIVIAIFDP